MFLFDGQTVNLPFAFVYTVFCLSDILPCTPAIQEERTLEDNAVPLRLLPTAERNIGQQRI